jgi:hypothetical protein
VIPSRQAYRGHIIYELTVNVIPSRQAYRGHHDESPPRGRHGRARYFGSLTRLLPGRCTLHPERVWRVCVRESFGSLARPLPGRHTLPSPLTLHPSPKPLTPAPNL